MKDNNFYIYLRKQIPVMMVLSLLPGLGYIFLGFLYSVHHAAIVWYGFICLVSIWGYRLYRIFSIETMTESQLRGWYIQASATLYLFFLLWCIIFFLYVGYDEYNLHYIAIFTQIGASVVAAAILYPNRILYKSAIFTLMLPLIVYFFLIDEWFGYMLSLFSLTLTWVLLYAANGTGELLGKTSYQANHDWLTGLYNRQFFIEYLQKKMNTLASYEKYSYLLLIDLDHFKTVNDSLGHDVGDRLLIQVAERISSCIDENSMLARLGGDEFIVTGESYSSRQDCKNQALEISEKLLTSLKEVYAIDKHHVYISCSIGASMINPNNLAAMQFIKEADIAMYEVKEKGRDDVFFFDEEMSGRVEYNLQVENLLHSALIKDEIYLNFQPQFDLSRNVSGVEVLARWKSPELGEVPPDKFIPLAEQTGIIIELGQYLLKQAFTHFSAWKRTGLVLNQYSINISMRQLMHARFVDDVKRYMDEYLDDEISNKIVFELTESIVAEDSIKVISIMQRLIDFGISFSMDDFGTGYSSLSYIKQLPVDELKIDRSFVKDIGVDDSSEQMIETILKMANIFKLRVVAEGVESETQLEFMQKNHCALVQGYYFSPPMIDKDFIDYCENNNKET